MDDDIQVAIRISLEEEAARRAAEQQAQSRNVQPAPQEEGGQQKRSEGKE